MKNLITYFLFIVLIQAILTGCGGVIPNEIIQHELERHLIVFDSNGGTLINNLEVISGDRPELPTPSREGFEFIGWFIEDTSITVELRSFDIISTDYFLRAKWEQIIVSIPSLSGIENVTIEIGDAFDPLAGVSASDETDGNLTDAIQLAGAVNNAVAGTYTLTYSVTNSFGQSISRTRTVTIRETQTNNDSDVFVLANGRYNFKFAPIDLKHQFFAEVERWLLENQIGGIPLWASSSFTLFSSRMQLPTNTHDPVMGFGVDFGSMSAADSTVIMDNGRPGNAGEFTYRISLSSVPVTFNHWLEQDSISKEVISTFLEGLYYFGYNSDFSGFEVKPSMASALPSPVEPTSVFGTTVSNVWSVPVRAGMRWTYNAATDTSDFPAGHEVINAQSFVDTYKLAVDEGWFRAISGGGDFLAATQRIKNMREYIDGDVEWSEVGIRAEGNNIVFEFVPLMSEWNVIYWLSGFTLSPINLALYESVGAQYGTSAETTAYNGRFFIETYEPDRIIRLKRNPNFWDPGRNNYTGYTFEIINDAEIAFQSFLAGRLDAVDLTAARFDEFSSFPGIRFAPGATVFRMNINSMGNVANQREEWPDGSWIPEPILQYPDMHKALYFGADRETLAYDVQRTAEPAMYYFTPAYLVDPAGGQSFRASEFGPLTLRNLSPDTNGFNPDAATAFFRSAVRQAIADGHYSRGDVITLNLAIESNNPRKLLVAEFLKESYEILFTDPQNNITVVVDIQAEPFPNNYFNVILPGEFDLGFGGISGSQLNAASFFNIFRSGPGRSPFVLNFGPAFDTEEPVIRIEYVDPVSGETKREIFSFSAIYFLLTSQAEIVDGKIIYD